MAHNKFHASLALTGICVLLGVIIGIQFNTVKEEKLLSTESQRLTELTATLKQVQEENAALSDKLAAQEEKIREYETTNNSSVLLDAAQKELQKAKDFAGLTEVTGNGLTITMTDSTYYNGGDSNAYVIHAEDILSVINELWTAGAEAISINGQRVVTTTGITCAGSIIQVNGVRAAAPFVISAIGDASVLQSALEFPGGVIDNLSPWGIRINIKKETSLTIPAYTLTTQWQYATPTEQKGENVL